MPVITENGLAGRVRQVLGHDLALVQLLTEEDSRISVEVARTGVTGLLRHDGRRFFIDHVPQGDPVRVGDEVVTSGLGGTVPEGLAVGRVTRVRSSPSELFQEVEVESTVRFSALSRVYVVTRDGPWYAGSEGMVSALPDSQRAAVRDTSEGARR
jgi:rod shape-determining protein MreC